MNFHSSGFLSAFLLCAGKGARFAPHTHILPKALLPFLNLPLVSYNLYLLKTLGVKKIAVNTHLHSDLLVPRLTQQAEIAGIKDPAFNQEEKLLGSAGGLYQFKNFFEKENHFFYFNGDSFIWPEKEGILDSVYQSHVDSKALASFLVRPTTKTTGVIWAQEKQNGKICSFLKKPSSSSSVKPYDFLGLALFSHRIFKVLKAESVHIFKDVLEGVSSDLRVHSLSGLKRLDMNRLDTYLQGVQEILSVLQNHSKSFFIREILDLFSPSWCHFSGKNYFSATALNEKFENKEGFLFCGKKVQGLEKLSVKNFAVLGDHCSLPSSVCMDSSVLGEKINLKYNITKKLVLRNSTSLSQ